MSFLVAAYLMQKYGPLLTEAELAEVLKMEPGTVRNKRARGGAWHFLHSRRESSALPRRGRCEVPRRHP